MPQQIFISYSRQNTAVVQRLMADLVQAGLPVWIDHDDLVPGTPNWETALREAISGADWVLLAASPDSRASAYVQDELAFARDQNVPIIPVWLAGESWLDSISLGMGRVQYVDMRGERYQEGLNSLFAILQYHSPEEVIAVQTGFLPLPVHLGLQYGIVGGLITGLALQYPLRVWLTDWLLTTSTFDSLQVAFWLFAPLPILLFGLALTMLFVGQRGVLPTARLRSVTGGVIGAVFALMVHTMAIGAHVGLIANREMLHIFNHEMNSPRWLEIIADSTLRTGYEGLIVTLLTVAILTFSGVLFSQWLLPLSSAGYVAPRHRDLFWPIMLVLAMFQLEITSFTSIILLTGLQSGLQNAFTDIGVTRNIPILSIIVISIWVLKLVLQTGILVWLWQLPLAAIHRTGLRTAQIMYGIIFPLLVIGLTLFLTPDSLTSLLTLALSIFSIALAISFAVLAQSKLSQAREINLPVQLKLVWWHALLVFTAVGMLLFLLTDLLMGRTMINLVLITVVMITVQDLASADWQTVFETTIHTAPQLVITAATAEVLLLLVFLVPYLWWATRRERRLSMVKHAQAE